MNVSAYAVMMPFRDIMFHTVTTSTTLHTVMTPLRVLSDGLHHVHQMNQMAEPETCTR